MINGLLSIPSRALVCLSGADKVSFLQGMVTSNVISLMEKAASSQLSTPISLCQYTAFLNGTGRVLFDSFLYPFNRNEDILMEIDERVLDDFLAHLRKYRLRSRVQTKILSYASVAFLSHRCDSIIPSICNYSFLVAAKDPRVENFGYRFIQSSSSIAECDKNEYTRERYRFGLCEGLTDFPLGVMIPQESNLDLLNAIDFQKGCYIGQELVIRTRHRGVVRKRVVPLHRVSGSSSVETPSLSLFSSVGDDFKKPIGKLISQFEDKALGLVRLDPWAETVFSGSEVWRTEKPKWMVY